MSLADIDMVGGFTYHVRIQIHRLGKSFLATDEIQMEHRWENGKVGNRVLIFKKAGKQEPGGFALPRFARNDALAMTGVDTNEDKFLNNNLCYVCNSMIKIC